MPYGKGFRIGVVALSISSLLYTNMVAAGVLASSISHKVSSSDSSHAHNGINSDEVNHTLLPASNGKPKAPEVKTAKSVLAKQIQSVTHASLHAGKQDAVLSNAFNFKSLYGMSVDPRTGMLSFQYTVGHIIGNSGFGPNLTLKLLYSQSSRANAYGLADGWSVNLTHYDPTSHMVSLSNGGSFRITDISSTGLLYLQYAKLDVLHVYKGSDTDPYYLKLVFKDGHLEYLNNAGYLTQIQSPRGDAISFDYDTSTGGHVLTAIHDGEGHQIEVKHVGSDVELLSQGDEGQMLTTTLSVRNGRVMKITLPDPQAKVTFDYGHHYGKQLIDAIHYPTGGWDSFSYTQLLGPVIHGQVSSRTYAVRSHTSHPNPGTSPEDLTTTYAYNVIPGHNYLARGANVPYSSTDDLLFLAPQDYRYGTQVSNGKTTIQYEYNKFHLLMDQQTLSSAGTLLQDATQCYATNASGGKVCGEDRVSQSITDLPAFYTLPVEQRVTYYTPGSSSLMQVNHQPFSRPLTGDSRTVVTQKSYDDQGNVLSALDASGRYSIASYNGANKNGFITEKASKVLYPTKPTLNGTWQGVKLKSALAPAPIKTTYHYLHLPPLKSGPKANLSLEDLVQESYLDAAGNWHVFREKANHYYGQDSAGLLRARQGDAQNYALLSQATVSEPQDPHHLDRLSSQAQGYHYSQASQISFYGKSYDVLEKQTQTHHHTTPNQLRADKPVTTTNYVSRYTGHKLLVKDANGNESAFIYDALGRKVQAIANVGSSLEATKTYAYHMGVNNNKVIVTAANGYQSKVVYDGLGRELAKYVERLDANGKAIPNEWDEVSSNTYDRYGNKVSSTSYDTNGQGQTLSLTIYYQYDSQNRPTVVSYPDGAAKVTVYDDGHNRTISYTLGSNGIAIENPHRTLPCRIGNTYYQATIKNFMVTDYNNMTDKKHPHGKEIASYLIASNPAGTDAKGNALYDTALKQALTENEAYLARGMVLDPTWLPSWIEQVIQNKAYYSKSSKTYDGFGRAIAIEDVNGNVTQQVFDAKGHLTHKILPNGNTQVMGYDVAGKLVQIGVIMNGNRKNLGKRYYNASGYLVWEEDRLHNKHQYQHDASGHVTQITTPNVQVIHQQYDGMNKLIKRSVKGDKAGLYTTTWAYDAKTGKVIQRVDATGTTDFSYYPNGKLKTINHTTENSKPGQVQPAYSLSYTYTLAGNPKSITDATGKTTEYHYNTLGQLEVVMSEGKPIISYQYDHYSRLSTQSYPGHIKTVYGYDDYNGLASLTHEQTNKTITAYTYTYNQDGTICTRTRTDATGQQAKETYTYDKNNNLVGYQCQGGLCPQDQRHNTINSQRYTFDEANNIQSIQSSLTTPQGKVIQNTTTYHYSPQLPTRLVSYQNSNQDYGNSPTLVYDKDGNMIQDDQYHLITYDRLGRTQAIHNAGQDTPIVTYLYNGDNVQIGEQATKQSPLYFIYGQGQLLNSQQNNTQTRYLYAGKQRIAKQANGTTTDYLTDQGNSVIHLIQTDKDNQPKIIGSYVYSPYGIESTIDQDKKAQSQKLFGFDGQLTDPHTGWQFLGKGYRAYNPLLHRFMSHDSMSPFDKGGTNGYVFANNNPIMKFDPSGHVPKWLSPILPHTTGGWVGFALAGAVGLVAGGLVSAFAADLLSGAADIATASLIGGMSNIVGQYVGHGIDTHRWRMNAKEARHLSVAFGMVLARWGLSQQD